MCPLSVQKSYFSRETANFVCIEVGVPEVGGPLGRPRRTWEDNINIYLREVGLRAWTRLIWLRRDRWWAPVNAVMNLRVP